MPHQKTDVQALDCDFLVFSGHKLLGPSGVGVLYGKRELLEAMPPFLGGGSMIRRVLLDRFEPGDMPAKFEAGTPPIVSAIGLGAAIDYLNRIGMEAVARHERLLVTRAHEILRNIAGVRILGPAPDRKAGIVSFTLEGSTPTTWPKSLTAPALPSVPGTIAPCPCTIATTWGRPPEPASIFTTPSTRSSNLGPPWKRRNGCFIASGSKRRCERLRLGRPDVRTPGSLSLMESPHRTGSGVTTGGIDMTFNGNSVVLPSLLIFGQETFVPINPDWILTGPNSLEITDPPGLTLSDLTLSSGPIAILQPVPEPGTLSLTCVAVLGLLGCVWRRRCSGRMRL